MTKAIAVGVGAGILGAGFRLALDLAERGRDGLVAHLPGLMGLLLMGALGVVGGGVSVWLVRRFAPQARGSGSVPPRFRGGRRGPTLGRETCSRRSGAKPPGCA